MIKPIEAYIYTASKIRHAGKWRDLRIAHPDIHFTARWPYLETEVPPTPEQGAIFWPDDFTDIENADFVLAYGADGDVLRGALVEVGAALATGRRVIIVADDTVGLGTWQYHPHVLKANNIRHAFNIAKMLTATLGLIEKRDRPRAVEV